MTFVEITGSNYTDLLRRRLTGETPELTWVQQFRDLLSPYLKPGASLLDLGCATGYAYKSFQKFDLRYTGLDVENTYLDIARDYFAGNGACKFLQHNIMEQPSPVKADIVICSATLE